MFRFVFKGENGKLRWIPVGWTKNLSVPASFWTFQFFFHVTEDQHCSSWSGERLWVWVCAPTASSNRLKSINQSINQSSSIVWSQTKRPLFWRVKVKLLIWSHRAATCWTWSYYGHMAQPQGRCATCSRNIDTGDIHGIREPRTHPAEEAHDGLRLPDELVEVEAPSRERSAVRARAVALLHVHAAFSPPFPLLLLPSTAVPPARLTGSRPLNYTLLTDTSRHTSWLTWRASATRGRSLTAGAGSGGRYGRVLVLLPSFATVLTDSQEQAGARISSRVCCLLRCCWWWWWAGGVILEGRQQVAQDRTLRTMCWTTGIYGLRPHPKVKKKIVCIVLLLERL